MKRIAIISPSGKFYGSEQVLFDFLCTTQHKYVIYVPEGTFYDKIKRCSYSAFIYISKEIVFAFSLDVTMRRV